MHPDTDTHIQQTELMNHKEENFFNWNTFIYINAWLYTLTHIWTFSNLLEQPMMTWSRNWMKNKVLNFCGPVLRTSCYYTSCNTSMLSARELSLVEILLARKRERDSKFLWVPVLHMYTNIHRDQCAYRHIHTASHACFHNSSAQNNAPNRAVFTWATTWVVSIQVKRVHTCVNINTIYMRFCCETYVSVGFKCACLCMYAQTQTQTHTHRVRWGYTDADRTVETALYLEAQNYPQPTHMNARYAANKPVHAWHQVWYLCVRVNGFEWYHSHPLSTMQRNKNFPHVWRDIELPVHKALWITKVQAQVLSHLQPWTCTSLVTHEAQSVSFKKKLCAWGLKKKKLRFLSTAVHAYASRQRRSLVPDICLCLFPTNSVRATRYWLCESTYYITYCINFHGSDSSWLCTKKKSHVTHPC